MQNSNILNLAMPNIQVLKFYFPIKESTIAQLECLTVETLIQVIKRQKNTVNKILLLYKAQWRSSNKLCPLLCVLSPTAAILFCVLVFRQEYIMTREEDLKIDCVGH